MTESKALVPRVYGGGVVNSAGQLLLRRPKGHFDRHVWTFPKGKADLGESPEEVAIREVQEETGYLARIERKIPGEFPSGSSVTVPYLMAPRKLIGSFDPTETSRM